MLIDVRTKEEYEEGHHDGAVSIPLDTLQDISLPCGTDEEITLYCRSGGRAHVAQQILTSKGYTNVQLRNGTGAY